MSGSVFVESTLIVGASASIGHEIVNTFVRHGKLVVATYNANEPKDESGAEWVKLDLSSAASIEALARRCSSIETVLLLPSVLLGKPLEEYFDDEIDRVMEINFTGQFRLLQRLEPLLIHDSQIIAMASISGHRGSYDPLYAPSKGAILALVKPLARRLAPKTRVNAVAPGLIRDSTMSKKMSEDIRNGHLQQTPMGRLLEVSDLAEILHDLTRPHWRHLNGACIDINGGQHVR